MAFDAEILKEGVSAVFNKKVFVNIIVIICVSWLITFLYLGNAPLLDPDEPVYAETALEMLQQQDFVSPRIYGDFWYDKPPMYYWLVAASFKVFGVGEFAARFPSAVLSVLGSILIYLCGRKIFSERAALLSALILSTSVEYFYLSKAAVTDITLTFFLSAALLAYLREKYYWLYTCMALAVVTKGPVGLLFCGGIIGIYLLLTRSLDEIKRMKLLSGAALFTAIAAPWYLAMYYYHGMDFINTFLGFHNITRFLQPEHATGTLWYYYLPVLIIGFFPWTAFLVQAFLAGVREKGPERNAIYFLLIWLSVIFLFFTFSQTKLVSYILPMYPPLALLIGWYFDKAWAKRSKVLSGAAVILTLAALLLTAGAFYGTHRLTLELASLLKVLAGGFLLFVLLVWGLSYYRSFRGVFMANVAGMILFSAFLMTQMLPVLSPSLEVKSLVSEFKQYYDGQSPVYVAKFYRPGFAFYSGLPGIELKAQDEDVFDKTQKAYFVVQKKYYDNLPPVFQGKVHLLASVADKVVLLYEMK